MYGPAELSLVPELPVPAAKLALFQTACFNPTIAGSTHAAGRRCIHNLMLAGLPYHMFEPGLFAIMNGYDCAGASHDGRAPKLPLLITVLLNMQASRT